MLTIIRLRCGYIEYNSTYTYILSLLMSCTPNAYDSGAHTKHIFYLPTVMPLSNTNNTRGNVRVMYQFLKETNIKVFPIKCMKIVNHIGITKQKTNA